MVRGPKHKKGMVQKQNKETEIDLDTLKKNGKRFNQIKKWIRYAET